MNRRADLGFRLPFLVYLALAVKADALDLFAPTSMFLTGSANEGARFNWEDRKILSLEWTVSYSPNTLALSEYT
jgi:hypothetical protein